MAEQLRTQEQIVERIKVRRDADVLGFEIEVLYDHLDLDHLRQFLKPDAEMKDWTPEPCTRERVLELMRDYMVFAWTKVAGHRGISAGRSVNKMGSWLWLLGDEDLEVMCADVDCTHYRQYGAPILAAICEKYRTPCRSPQCNAKVIHGFDVEGKRVVLDARRHPIYVPTPTGKWVRVTEARVSHFATCADASRFSRCPKCGAAGGGHFIPPPMGEDGFYTCARTTTHPEPQAESGNEGTKP